MEDMQERLDEDRYNAGRYRSADQTVHKVHSKKVSSNVNQPATCKAVAAVSQGRKEEESMEEIHKLRRDNALLQRRLLKAQNRRTQARSEVSRLTTENAQLQSVNADVQQQMVRIQALCAQLQREKDKALKERDEAEQSLMDEWAHQDGLMMQPRDKVVTRSFRELRGGAGIANGRTRRRLKSR